MQTILTHKGWFGLCPVYFGQLQSEAPVVIERHALFVPLMMLSEGLYALAAMALTLGDPAADPQWPLRVTGELTPPRPIDIPET